MGEPRRYKYTGEAADPGTGHGQSAPRGYLKNKETKAADYNQTRANLQTERTRKSRKDAQGKEVALIHPLPGEVTPKVSKMEAAQINNLRKATTGLVNYNGSLTFPWSETVIGNSTKLKAEHLEEVRQVIDDSKNNARCGDSCSSGCARACSVTCAAETCKNGCGMACMGGCGEGCKSGCGDLCSGTCGKTCKTNCGSTCKESCGFACEDSCGAKCTTGCGDRCSGTCGEACTGTCGDLCKSGCGGLCSASCGNGCTGTSMNPNACSGCGKSCTGDCSDTCTGGCKGSCSGCTDCSGCSGWIW